MKQNLITLIGFLIFLSGFISIVLALVGLDLSFLRFLEHFGKGGAFVIKLFMVFGGMVMFYVARTGMFFSEK